MARDRQRAKQRRAQRQSSARKIRDVERELGLGGDADPADPLRHGSADVDEARLSEAGATPPDVGDGEPESGVYDDELTDDRPDRAPDEVEGDARIVRSAEQTERAAHRGRRPRFITFLGHCIDELRRVQWPNRRQVFQATAVVLGFVVIAGGYLGLLDALWQPLINKLL
jgi:preprotein translocase SecE subunit